MCSWIVSGGRPGQEREIFIINPRYPGGAVHGGKQDVALLSTMLSWKPDWWRSARTVVLLHKPALPGRWFGAWPSPFPAVPAARISGRPNLRGVPGPPESAARSPRESQFGIPGALIDHQSFLDQMPEGFPDGRPADPILGSHSRSLSRWPGQTARG